MYKDYTGPMPTTQAEHLSMANEMANAILERFEFNEQNEILDHIKRRLIEDREKRKAELQMQLERTDQMLSSLISPRLNPVN